MNCLRRKVTSFAAAAALVVSSIPLTGWWINEAEAAVSIPEGFVYADGTKFMCDGSPYYYGGTNCYYMTYKSQKEVKNVFDDASAMGLKVIRIWGNLDVGKKTSQVNPQSGYPVFEGNNDGLGEKDGVYFQYWDDELGKPVVNEGADGLRRLDYIIKQAEEHDMKLIITFTNYWEAFGGMGQYVKWYKMSQGQSVSDGKVDEKDVCEFYTNETIKGWYKNYINTLLNHENYYTGEKLMESEAVFSWELSNEPRCTVDNFCENDVLYNWAKEMSEYVKSIDPYHMVSVGDEGFYNLGYQNANSQGLPSAAYSGYYGVDFDKLMTIETVDFGTPHMYVDQWGFDLNADDLEWIKRHSESTQNADKPVIFEEFGLTDKSKRNAAYTDWLDIVTGDYYDGIEYQGFNYWMIASYLDDGSLYQDYDGYTVYGPVGIESTDSARTIIVNAADKMNKKNIVNTVDKSSYTFDRSSAADVEINVSLKMGEISGLKFNGQVLTNGKEFNILGSKITISVDYLKNMSLSKYTCQVLTTGGNQPKFSVVVKDSSIPDPVITPSTVSIDVNPRVCQDVTITMDLKTSEFRGISTGSKTLTEGSDYTVSGNTVVLKKSFLETLEAGVNTLVFDFYEGSDCTLTINTNDTTGLDEFDTFDSYGSDTELWNSYSRNTSGNELSLSLADKNGSKALAFSYDVSSPNGYCGVNHPISVRDASSYDGVELWLEGDGSGNSFTIQLRDGNDKYFEEQITVDFVGGKTIQIPFADFVAPSWQGDGNLDTSKINQFSFYAGNGGSKDSGTYYIDDVILYKKTVQSDKPYIVNKTGSFDASAPSGVRTDLVLYGMSVSSVVCNGNTLVGGVDYSTNGSQLMLNETFLNTLSTGTYSLVYTFSDGTTDTFTLTVVNADVHTHSYQETVVAPTYAAEGYTLHTCSSCGDSYKDNYTAKKTVPAAAISSSYTSTGTSFTLNWGKISEATGYNVYKFDGVNKKWVKVKTVIGAGNTSATVSGFIPGSVIKFKVNAYTVENGKTYYGPTSTFLSAAAIGNANISKSYTSTGDSITLNWAKVNGATGYLVYKYDSTSGKWVKAATVSGADNLTATIANVTPGSVFKFKVNAYLTKNGKTYYGKSGASIDAAALAPASFNSSYTAAATSASVSWGKVSGATGYKIYKYDSANKKWVLVKTVTGADTTSATVTGLTSGTTTKLKVNAYLTKGTKTYVGKAGTMLSVKTK